MKMMMQSFLLLMATVLLLPVAEAAVEATCKAIAAGDPNVRYDFCVRSLRRDPASGSADTKGLALIAVELSSQSTARFARTVESALEKAKGAGEKESLRTCSSLYRESRSRLADSASAVEVGRLGDAKTYLSTSVDAPDGCGQAFDEMGVPVPAPLEEENDEERQLCIIALAITNLLG
ncbi:hypothetical protein Cni_G03650 [Canna indica]|uniref:Pectinesterase inhibitor domain-containing protein n=1 Tax=Canna indica TaxID=4628 RepID=A0AAQ3Q388_9LILI|nr:hypothetical protein Cni_G03650 [Canna indica]